MITLQNYCNVISCEQSTRSRILGAINLSLSEAITWKKSKKRNQTSQRSSGRHPPPAGRSVAGWSRRQICRAGKEKATLEAEIARLREAHSQKLSKEAQKLMKMPFQRAITKKSRLIWASWRKVFADWWLCTQWPRWAVKWACRRWLDSLRLRFKRLRRLVRSYQPASGLP